MLNFRGVGIIVFCPDICVKCPVDSGSLGSLLQNLSSTCTEIILDEFYSEASCQPTMNIVGGLCFGGL